MIFNAVLSSSSGDSKEEQEKSVTITENGTTEVMPDSGKTLSKVTITTNVTGGGGGTNKLPQVVDGTLLNITAEDLQGATKIAPYAFYQYTSLKNIIIPSSATSIGNNAFMYCSKLSSITIPDTVTSIGQSAFVSCTSLKSITIPNGITSISNSMLNNCTLLESITIPDSVTSIANGALQNCSALRSVTIPSAVTSIGSYALKIGSTTRKATITMKSTTPPTIKTTTFHASYLNKIIVPAGTGSTYRAATNWSAFADYITENKNGSGGAGA